MDQVEGPAPPKTVAERLREIPLGSSYPFDTSIETVSANTIRQTASRLKDARYVTRFEQGRRFLRVWRLNLI